MAAARGPSSHAPVASVARVSQDSSTCWAAKHGLLKGGQLGRWFLGFGDSEQDHVRIYIMYIICIVEDNGHVLQLRLQGHSLNRCSHRADGVGTWEI